MINVIPNFFHTTWRDILLKILIAFISGLILILISFSIEKNQSEINATIIQTHSDPNIHFSNKNTGNTIFEGSYSLSLIIKNEGQKSINPEDYVSPISISLPKDLVIIQASSMKIQGSIFTNLTPIKNSIKIKNHLLNQGDEVIVSIQAGIPKGSEISTIERFNFWEKNSHKIEITGEIKGVEIPKLNFLREVKKTGIYFSWGFNEVESFYFGNEILFLAVLAIIIYYITIKSIESSLQNIDFLVINFICIFVLIVSISTADSVFYYLFKNSIHKSAIIANFIGPIIFLILVTLGLRQKFKKYTDRQQ